MNQLKSGILSIILGNLLYLVYIFLSGNETTNFGDFSKGVLLGLSIGSNLVGIILTAAYIGKKDKKKEEWFKGKK